MKLEQMDKLPLGKALRAMANNKQYSAEARFVFECAADYIKVTEDQLLPRVEAKKD